MSEPLNPIVYAIPVFLATILIEAGFAWWRKAKVFDLADSLTSLHFGVMSQLAGAVTKFAAFGIYVLVFDHLRVTTWSMNSLVAWTAALILYDFCYYWLHRMGHEVGVLWAAHVVHHSSEYYNLTTALRQTSSGALLGWIFYLPMAVMGVPPLMFVTVGLIDLLYQYWVHTELVGRLGPLDRILVTPSNHRVHHGQNDYCIDRNYGGILILWDRLFGTFVEEREGGGLLGLDRLDVLAEARLGDGPVGDGEAVVGAVGGVLGARLRRAQAARELQSHLGQPALLQRPLGRGEARAGPVRQVGGAPRPTRRLGARPDQGRF